MESQRNVTDLAAPSDTTITEEKGLQDGLDDGLSGEMGDTPKVIYPPKFTQVIVILGIMLATFLVALDMSIVGTAIPKITTDFNTYGSAFFLTLAAFVSAWGKAYKYFSLRIVYVLAVFIFEVGSLICALAPSSLALIIGRAVQGLGAAGLVGGGYTIAAFVIPPNLQPTVVGLMGSVFTIASVAGPLLGGVFTSDVTWRWCFYINLPVGAVTILCMLVFFRTPALAKLSHGTAFKEILISFDPVGSVLMFSGVLCFLIAVQWGGVKYPWNSAMEIGLLVGCVVISTLFAINEWLQGDRALIVFRILRTRSIGACAGFIFFLNAANIALQYNLPVYFQAILGNSAVGSGIKMIPSIIATSSIAIGKLQIFQPFLLGSAIIGTIGVGLIYTLKANASLGVIIGYQILCGVGTGLGVQTPNLVATVSSAPEDVSIAVATTSFFMLLAGAWGVAVTDAITNNLILQKVPHYAPGIDPQAVLAVGSAGIKTAYRGAALEGVQRAYLEGLRGGWALAIAAFGVTFLWALVPRWPGRLAPARGDGSMSQGDGEKSAPIAPAMV
ncbi:hypothetical protein G7046_g5232 [Stylonectria norvegica]|nr:hypothetical protein G7046_g5232 [Stylonectria norvegica]